MLSHQKLTFSTAIYGNFVSSNNPSISSEIAANGTNNPITNWPVYTNAAPYQINLNQTGGEVVEVVGTTFAGEPVNVTESVGPGLKNDISLVNAWTWEGGRGTRCDFWRAMGVLVPE